MNMIAKKVLSNLGAFFMVFDVSGESYREYIQQNEVPKITYTPDNYAPFLVYEDFELVGSALRDSMNNLHNELIEQGKI